MSKISQEIIERVKDCADIVDVIGKSVSLRKQGTSYIGVCPFHSDKTPSLFVNKNKNMYKCFACGAGGDIIQFVQENEHISFVDAIKQLASTYNIEIPTFEETAEESARSKKKESCLNALSAGNKLFVLNLSNSPQASEYLFQNRKLTFETSDVFFPGYAKRDNSLKEELEKSNYSFDTVLSAGLSGVSEKGYKYDVFRDRITLPFLDMYGRVIGFTGRYIGEDNDKNAKYLNTPETFLFTKGNAIFGLFQAKKEISRQSKAYWVEGQFDVMSFYQNGLQNTVAGSGTAMTEAQAKLMKRFCDKVVLVYDGDNAGIKACIASAKVLFAVGIEVKAVILPTGIDPDDFAKEHTDKLPSKILSLEIDFIDYLLKIKNEDQSSDFDKMKMLDLACDCIAVVPDKFLKSQMMKSLSIKMKTGIENITDRVNSSKTTSIIEDWKDGFIGVQEAIDLKADTYILSFSQNEFIQAIGKEPIVYACGNPVKADLQLLISQIADFEIKATEEFIPVLKEEINNFVILKMMQKHGFNLTVSTEDENLTFYDYYIKSYGKLISSPDVTSTEKAIVIGRCVEIIADLENSVRTLNLDIYAKQLGTKATQIKDLLKPYLGKKKDKAVLDTQRLSEIGNLQPIDSEKIPDYIQNDKALYQDYVRSGYYPLYDKENRPVSYMFRTESGNSHICVSDFYMKPLLHVYDNKDGRNNKRVIQLCHMHKKLDRFVEWQSNTFANLNKVNEKLIEEGAYNFEGTLFHFKKIWRSMSYGFTYCREIRVFGQQPEGFFAFGNALHHEVAGEYKIEEATDLGIYTHNDENFYSPTFSRIRLADRQENDAYNQARHLVYKEIKEDKKISFDEWASLMDKVYSINNNGKWATLYAITCAFRDFIFKNRRYFTALFFIGPTSSGKSQVAESIRNLFMDSKTPSFNLNTGTDASFFMLLESLRNIPVVFEEYNDKSISPVKFQGLKSATLDGEGKMKIKDVSSKTMDSSEINASIVMLGQEAAQQDDGALSNRCIMCDVPYRASGDFTEEETALFERLKKHEDIGLCNILVQVLELRPLYEKYYLTILSDETQKIKDHVKTNLTNTEGLARILNAVALMTSTLRLFEEHVPSMKLPFTYDEFFQIASEKVISQIDKISSSNKLSTYFQTMSTLITHNKLKIGRDIKLSETQKIKVLGTGKVSLEREFEAGTKLLFIDFESVYILYQGVIGKEESLSRQSLRSYFESNKSYVGLSKSTRFSWLEPEQTPSVSEATLNGDNIETSNVARLRMIKKEKQTSAYVFNYTELKEIIDIDFDRTVQEEKIVDTEELPF